MTATAFSSAQRLFWDGFATEYERLHESTTVLVARALHEQLRPEDASVHARGRCRGRGWSSRSGAAHAARCRPGDQRLLSRHAHPGPGKASAAHERNPGSRIHFVEADAQALPFADGSFDRYVSNLTLMLVEDPLDALTEAARVLLPGGRAGGSVWGRRERSPLRTLFFDAVGHLGMSLTPPDRSPFHLGQSDALRPMLERAGFDRVLCWYMSSVVAVDDAACILCGRRRADGARRTAHRSRSTAGGT